MCSDCLSERILLAGDILAFGSDASVRNRSYNFQEFLGCYERLATFQAKAARQERIKVRASSRGSCP